MINDQSTFSAIAFKKEKNVWYNLSEKPYLILEVIILFLHVFSRPEGFLLNESDFSALQNNFSGYKT